MGKLLLVLVVFFLKIEMSLAVRVEGDQRISIGVQPDNSMLSKKESLEFVDILTAIEAFLLKVALPLVIIGTSLYIAYEMFMADGNEEKSKKAWKSVTFGVIGILCISLSYAIVAIISRLSL